MIDTLFLVYFSYEPYKNEYVSKQKGLYTYTYVHTLIISFSHFHSLKTFLCRICMRREVLFLHTLLWLCQQNCIHEVICCGVLVHIYWNDIQRVWFNPFLDWNRKYIKNDIVVSNQKFVKTNLWLISLRFFIIFVYKSVKKIQEKDSIGFFSLS